MTDKPRLRTQQELDDLVARHSPEARAALMKQAKIIPRDQEPLKSLLEACEQASIADLMDENGVLVGSALRDVEE